MDSIHQGVEMHLYKDFARQVSAEKLELELDSMHGGVETHLTAIAKKLDDWEDVGTALKLTRRELKDIIEDYRDSPNRR